MIRTIIFDIDNTLYDFYTVNRYALDVLADYTVQHFGWTREKFESDYKQAQDEILRVMGGYAGGVRDRVLRIQLILEKNGLPLHPHVVDMYDLYWDTLLANMNPSEGLIETMQGIKEKGIRIGAGTDMTACMQFRKLRALGVLSFFDFAVTSEEAGIEKPDEKLFERLLEKSMCSPEECLFVGDHPVKDYQGATGAGMQALWYNPEKKEDHAHYAQISDLRQILDLI